MSILLSDDMLKNALISEEELRLELAIFLFQKGILTLGKASESLEVPQFILQKELATRKIPLNYGYQEFQEDLTVVEEMNSNH
ncbi:MAG: UPF0175 family protein [Bacteroidota bacterium]